MLIFHSSRAPSKTTVSLSEPASSVSSVLCTCTQGQLQDNGAKKQNKKERKVLWPDHCCLQEIELWMFQFYFEWLVLVCLHALGSSLQLGLSSRWSALEHCCISFTSHWPLLKNNVKYVQEYKRVTLLSKTLETYKGLHLKGKENKNQKTKLCPLQACISSSTILCYMSFPQSKDMRISGSPIIVLVDSL